jgi:hypothetical protein
VDNIGGIEMETPSLKGWQFVEWLRGNKESAKLVVSAIFGFWIPADPQVKVLAAALLKLILDTLDYALKEK